MARTVDGNAMTIRSPLSPGQVRSALRDAVHPPRLFTWFEIVGVVRADTAWFENRGLFNRGIRRLYLHISKGIDGIILRGKFGYPPVARFLYGTVALAVAAISIGSILQSDRDFSFSLAAVFCACMFFVFRLDLSVRTRREIELLNFLRKLLDVDAPRPPVNGTLIRPRHLQPDHSQTHPTD